MQGLERFEPDRGFRLATYAMWWIRAAIQEYILRSWSLVKMGTTANQKKLFFNLRRAKSKIAALQEGDLRPDQVQIIAKRLGVSDKDVIGMNRRSAATLRSTHRSATMAKPANGRIGSPRTAPVKRQRLPKARSPSTNTRPLVSALTVLDERERRIFEARRLADDPITLQELAREFGVSRERVRQLEVRAFEKVQDVVKNRIAEIEASHAVRVD